jgi:hypothetical protein
LPNFATGGGGAGAGGGGGAALLLGGGVVVTTVTVCDAEVVGDCGAATGLPVTVVPQPAVKAASSTTTCLPEGMAGTLGRARRLGYRRCPEPFSLPQNAMRPRRAAGVSRL